MKLWLADLLSPLSQIIYELASTVPMSAVRVIVFAILMLLALWVFKMPPQLPEKKEDRPISVWDDLRVFAFVVLAIQALFYLIF